jgi:hypothetical protein
MRRWRLPSTLKAVPRPGRVAAVVLIALTVALLAGCLGGGGGKERKAALTTTSKPQPTPPGRRAKAGRPHRARVRALKRRPPPLRYVRAPEFELLPRTRVKEGARIRRGRPIVPPTPMPRISGRPTAAALAAATATSISLYRNTDLGGGTGTLTAEPSVAVHGRVVFETWNFYAALSGDGGTSFSYLNPRSLPSVYGGFCCDQIAYYEPNYDLYIWVLQYRKDGYNNNALRVVVYKGAANLLAHVPVSYWDFTPQQLGDPNGVNYDQPKVTSTRNFLYLEATRYGNVATPGSRSVVLRLPLSTLASGGYLTYSYFRLSDDATHPYVFSPGLVQGTSGTTTAYFAGHVNYGTLRLYAWPESVDSGNISKWDVPHSAYPASLPHRCPRSGGSTTSDWCERIASDGTCCANDDRINSGWLANGILGFAWNASQGSGGLGTFAFPYVHVVRINVATKALVDQPVIWNPGFAFQYAAIVGNAQGALGGVTLWGGGPAYEDCAVLIHDSQSTSSFWDMVTPDTSNADPVAVNSGDYLTARNDPAYPGVWGASCFTLRGGGYDGNVHPYYVSFGRPGAVAP